MPTDLSNYPVMYGEKEREMLKNSCILEKIDIKVATWQQDYNLLCSAEPTLKEKISFKEFKEGLILASIRAYEITYTDGVPRQVLIPYFDVSLINYSEEPNVICN